MAAIAFESHAMAIFEGGQPSPEVSLALINSKRSRMYLGELARNFTEDAVDTFTDKTSEVENPNILDLLSEAKELHGDIKFHIDGLGQMNKLYEHLVSSAHLAAVEARMWIDEHFRKIDSETRAKEAAIAQEAAEKAAKEAPDASAVTDSTQTVSINAAEGQDQHVSDPVNETVKTEEQPPVTASTDENTPPAQEQTEGQTAQTDEANANQDGQANGQAPDAPADGQASQ